MAFKKAVGRKSDLSPLKALILPAHGSVKNLDDNGLSPGSISVNEIVMLSPTLRGKSDYSPRKSPNSFCENVFFGSHFDYSAAIVEPNAGEEMKQSHPRNGSLLSPNFDKHKIEQAYHQFPKQPAPAITLAPDNSTKALGLNFTFLNESSKIPSQDVAGQNSLLGENNDLDNSPDESSFSSKALLLSERNASRWFREEGCHEDKSKRYPSNQSSGQNGWKESMDDNPTKARTRSDSLAECRGNKNIRKYSSTTSWKENQREMTETDSRGLTDGTAMFKLSPKSQERSSLLDKPSSQAFMAARWSKSPGISAFEMSKSKILVDDLQIEDIESNEGRTVQNSNSGKRQQEWRGEEKNVVYWEEPHLTRHKIHLQFQNHQQQEQPKQREEQKQHQKYQQKQRQGPQLQALHQQQKRKHLQKQCGREMNKRGLVGHPAKMEELACKKEATGNDSANVEDTPKERDLENDVTLFEFSEYPPKDSSIMLKDILTPIEQEARQRHIKRQQQKEESRRFMKDNDLL